MRFLFCRRRNSGWLYHHQAVWHSKCSTGGHAFRRGQLRTGRSLYLTKCGRDDPLDVVSSAYVYILAGLADLIFYPNPAPPYTCRRGLYITPVP